MPSFRGGQFGFARLRYSDLIKSRSSVVKNLVRRVSSWLGVRDCCEERLEEGAQKPRQPA
jgi:hypothetical protein